MDFTLPRDWPNFGPIPDAYDKMTAAEFLASAPPSTPTKTP
jgi:hypothetical protein